MKDDQRGDKRFFRLLKCKKSKSNSMPFLVYIAWQWIKKKQ